MPYHIEHVFSSGCIIGEAPLWVPEEQTLYWTDTESNMIWSLNETDSCRLVRNWKLSLPVVAVMRREEGSFLIITKVGPAFWDKETNTCDILANPLAGKHHLSFNDGAVDREGKLVTGTMNHVNHPHEDGCIYQLDSSLTLTRMETGLSVANGIGLSLDGRTLYVSEQFKGRILSYRYDSRSGVLSDKHVFAEIPKDEGLPDGITVDAEGCVWNAHWGGGRITRYTPDGKKDLQIKLPVPITACLAFGGESLSDLYVTTGCYGMSLKEKAENTGSGDLFRIRTEFKGLREPRFRG